MSLAWAFEERNFCNEFSLERYNPALKLHYKNI